MEIKDLVKGKISDYLSGEIAYLGEKQFNETYGTTCREGILEDNTGQVKIVFWNEQCDNFKTNDVIKLLGGWCKEFDGELQVSSGKFGKIIKE